MQNAFHQAILSDTARRLLLAELETWFQGHCRIETSGETVNND